MNRRAAGKMIARNVEPSAEAKFYTVLGIVAGVIVFLGTPVLIDTDYFENETTKVTVMLFYTIGVFGIGGLLLLGLGIHVLQTELPITSSIGGFLLKAAVVVVVVSIALSWFFVVIPLFAFVAACVSSSKKSRRW